MWKVQYFSLLVKMQHLMSSSWNWVSRGISSTSLFTAVRAKPRTLQKCFKSTSELIFSSTHEYVICGAGSAGCVLANRLSADTTNRVLLLEAGPKDWSWKIHMPAALTYNLCDDKYNWYYETEPQEFMDNRRIYQPRGRVWGGSSSLNAMVYIRGHAYDYDRWEKEGAQGWSYADCLPYFRKSQTHELGSDDYRGGDGPLNVSCGKSENPLYKAFIDAGVQAGYPFTDDMNGYQQEGFGWMDKTVHKGWRWSTANAYLRPALGRKNLKTGTKAMITRIIFDKNRAIGVEYHQDNMIRRVRATKEVILCGGAINSPQLLMLSGVGNADNLKRLGIPVVTNLPGVGENFQDHLDMRIHQECRQPITLYSAQKLWIMIPSGVRWFLFRSGMCDTSHFEAGGFICTREGVPHPDLQYHFIPLAFTEGSGHDILETHAYQANVGSLRATSRGHIKLRSASPYEHPLIQPNYLSTEEDRRELRDAVRVTRDVFSQKAFDPYRGKELQPGDHIQTDDEIDAWVRANASTNYHPSCTCKMGSENDPMAVVDSKARVIGAENLRVVDASIMPSIVSGNLNGPTIMIAEKAADIILGNPPLPRSTAPVYETPEATKEQRK